MHIEYGNYIFWQGRVIVNRKLLVTIMVWLLLGISGCNDSNKNGVTSAPRKKWVDLRGTEVTVESKSGIALCMYIPNGVTVYKNQGEIVIEFEDFDSFSNSSNKHHNNLKVGVSSIFIRPESSISLINKKARLLSLGDNITLNLDGYEVIESKIGDRKSSVTIINIEKSIGIRFFPGKKIYEKYERNSYLTKLITEISAITQNCTKE